MVRNEKQADPSGLRELAAGSPRVGPGYRKRGLDAPSALTGSVLNKAEWLQKALLAHLLRSFVSVSNVRPV